MHALVIALLEFTVSVLHAVNHDKEEEGEEAEDPPSFLLPRHDYYSSSVLITKTSTILQYNIL